MDSHSRLAGQQRHVSHEDFNGEHSRLIAALAFIAPAKTLKHSGATLWAHLLGTYEILRAWGAPRDVCLAGALHSIYSTQYFPSPIASEDKRGDIARAVGRRAEGLAHAFCVLDRQGIRDAAMPSAWGSGRVRVARHSAPGRVRMAPSTVRVLRLIDLANEVDQRQRLSAGPGASMAQLVRAFREIGFKPVALPPQALTTSTSAETALLRNYAQGLTASKERAPWLFEQCVAAVPCCAEPRLLLAAAHLDAGQPGAAYADASTALAHLRGWAAAWDTRVPLLAWEFFALQLMEAARRGERRQPQIAGQIKARLRRDLARRPKPARSSVGAMQGTHGSN
jgi:hypothetical protein